MLIDRNDDAVGMGIAFLVFIVMVGVLAVVAGKDSRVDEIEHQRRLWRGVG